jgi:hypothetical protein
VSAHRGRTGLRALTEEEFRWSTIWWYVRNTGIPFAIGSIVLIGADRGRRSPRRPFMPSSSRTSGILRR